MNRTVILRRTLVPLSFALLGGVASCAKPAPNAVPAATPTVAVAASVEDAVRAFYMGMASETPAENRRAMEAMLPTHEDFIVLFPRHHEVLWKMWEPEREKLLRGASANTADYRAVLPIGDVHAVDLRQAGSIVLKRSIAELPPDVPVVGVRIEVSGAEKERSADAFLLVRGRWIWVWKLERAAAVAALQQGKSQ